MNKHTPGPWILASSKTEVLYIKNPHPYNTIAKCEWGGKEDGTGIYGHTMEEAEANARLIAAAPELLEKLNMCIGYIEAERSLGTPVNEKFLKMLLDTVIKAEGESK